MMVISMKVDIRMKTVQVSASLNKGIIHWHASGMNNGYASD